MLQEVDDFVDGLKSWGYMIKYGKPEQCYCQLIVLVQGDERTYEKCKLLRAVNQLME